MNFLKTFNYLVRLTLALIQIYISKLTCTVLDVLFWSYSTKGFASKKQENASV